MVDSHRRWRSYINILKASLVERVAGCTCILSRCYTAEGEPSERLGTYLHRGGYRVGQLTSAGNMHDVSRFNQQLPALILHSPTAPTDGRARIPRHADTLSRTVEGDAHGRRALLPTRPAILLARCAGWRGVSWWSRVSQGCLGWRRSHWCSSPRSSLSSLLSLPSPFPTCIPRPAALFSPGRHHSPADSRETSPGEFTLEVLLNIAPSDPVNALAKTTARVVAASHALDFALDMPEGVSHVRSDSLLQS